MKKKVSPIQWKLLRSINAIKNSNRDDLHRVQYVMDIIRQVGLQKDPAGETLYGSDVKYMNEVDYGVWQLPQQLAEFLISLTRYRIKTFLDIGTGRGWTASILTAYLMKFNSGFKTTCIDIDDTFTDYAHVKKILPIKYCPSKTSRDFKGKSYDLCFIDDGHEYKWCKEAYENVGIYANICAFHDINDTIVINVPENEGGVPRFWKELKKNEEGLAYFKEFLVHPNSYTAMGIGVRRRAEIIRHGKKTRKTLYIRFRGSIGDVCHYLSKMKDVRAKYPNHWIKCAIRCDVPYIIKELIELNPYIDEIEILPERDLGFDISAKFKSKIESEIGWGGKFLDFVLPGYGDLREFATEKNWRPNLSDSDSKFAENFYNNYVAGTGLITMHASSTIRKGSVWQWNIENYRKLCEHIAQNHSYKILIVGDSHFSLPHSGKILNLSDNIYLGITLREIIALILKSDIVIGGDSGFVVIAWLSGINVISLVPEKCITEGMYKDFLLKHLGVLLEATASTWLPKSYPAGNKNAVFPMEKIAVLDVYREANRMLADKNMIVSCKGRNRTYVYQRRRYRPWYWVWIYVRILRIQRRRDPFYLNLCKFIDLCAQLCKKFKKALFLA